MKKNLPDLNQERLSIIFKHVYDVASGRKVESGFKEEKLSDLLTALQAMQLFNYRHRPDDTRELYSLMIALPRITEPSHSRSAGMSCERFQA